MESDGVSDRRIFVIQLMTQGSYTDYLHREYGYVVGQSNADSIVAAVRPLMQKAAVLYRGEDGEGPWSLDDPAVRTVLAEIAVRLGVELRKDDAEWAWCDSGTEINAIELKQLSGVVEQ